MISNHSQSAHIYLSSTNQLTKENMTKFIIDITTKDKKTCMYRLRRKGYENVQDGGMYWQDKTLSQVWADSDTKTLDDLEKWLYSSGLDYIGAVERDA